MSQPSVVLSLLQFLWELHFIEAYAEYVTSLICVLQFLWELHFIEAGQRSSK